MLFSRFFGGGRHPVQSVSSADLIHQSCRLVLHPGDTFRLRLGVEYARGNLNRMKEGIKNMKKFLLCTVALISIGAVPASAADMAVKAPPIAAPMMYDWSGFYIGANGGYGWSRQCVDITAFNAVAFAFAEGCRDAGGGIAGGQIGYRWQSGTWVFGL
jgi:outer membrane immunogenic protein